MKIVFCSDYGVRTEFEIVQSCFGIDSCASTAENPVGRESFEHFCIIRGTAVSVGRIILTYDVSVESHVYG